MKILEQLQKKELFAYSEQNIVEYLLLNKDSIGKITIQELAKETYTSNATVIRFCQKFGYKGYKEFKLALILEVESMKYLVNTVDYSKPFKIAETPERIVNSIYSLYKETIDEVQSEINITDLEYIANSMCKSNRIFIFAKGDAKLTVKSFMNKLAKINYFPVLATENNEERHLVSYINKDDIVIFVTYSGVVDKYKYCIDTLVKNKIKIVVITANIDSYITKYSDRFILIPNKEKDDKIATFYSQLVFEYILNLLFAFMYNNAKMLSK